MNDIITEYINTKSAIQTSKNLSLPYRKVRNELNAHNLIKSRKRLKNIDFNYDFFANIDTQEKAYFLGLIHADGSVYYKEDKKRFSICLQAEDGYLLHKLAQCLNLPPTKVRYIEFPNKDCKPQYVLQIAHQEFVSHLENVKTSPSFPPYLASHFLRGVFDGDGTIYTKYSKKIHKYYYMGYIGNSTLVDIINTYSPVKFKFRSIASKGIFRSEIYSKADVLAFGGYLYKDSYIHMHRKHNKFIDAKYHYSSSTTTRKTPEPETEGDDIV